MTQDPYQFDDQSLDLSAEIDTGDEYDGLDMSHDDASSPRRKTGLIVLLMLLVLAGGGYATYTLFLNAPDDSYALNMQQQSAFQPPPVQPAMNDLPPAVSEAAPEEMPAYEDALNEAVPAVPDDMTDPSMDSSVDPVAPQDVIAEAVEPAPEVVPAPDAEPQTDIVPESVSDMGAAPVAPDDVVEDISAEKEAIVAEAQVPAPEANQLTPIDPVTPAPVENADAMAAATNDAVTGDAVIPAAPTPVKPDALSKMEAINDILQEGAMPADKLTEKYVEQAEVTPRAKQVIIVKRNYGAQSAQAAVVAGDRVLQAGEYTAAVEIYESQLKKNPSDPIALAGKAEALHRAGQTEETMDVYQRLIDLNPRDVGALTNYLGLLQKHDPTQALTRLKTLEQQYPENAAVAGQLGMVHARMMDTPNALRYLAKASALDPRNPAYPFNIAILYDRLGTVDHARNYYRQALDLTRNYPDRGNAVPVETIRRRLSTIGSE